MPSRLRYSVLMTYLVMVHMHAEGRGEPWGGGGFPLIFVAQCLMLTSESVVVHSPQVLHVHYQG